MNAPQRISLPLIGSQIGGGTNAGLYIDGQNLCACIVAPKADGEFEPSIWNKSLKLIDGARSFVDGLTNTQEMAAAGSKLAEKVLALRIGGHDDWHIPARDQLELVYRNLKPGAGTNWVYRNGDNPSAVPPGYPYTEQSPAQTTIEAFRTGNAEALEDAWYWTSTQYASSGAWVQFFDYGVQSTYLKSSEFRCRAVRRLIICPFNHFELLGSGQ
jgi:Protein of unknown function (DUF1566)